jgi:hypothetical protein
MHRNVWEANKKTEMLTAAAAAKKRKPNTMMDHFAERVAPTFQQSLLKWIVMCRLPYSMVDNPYFIELVHSLSPKAKVLDRKALVQAISLEAVNMKIVVEHSVKGWWYAITSDHWTSIAKISYVTVTIHYINTEWELKHNTLCLKAKRGQSLSWMW